MRARALRAGIVAVLAVAGMTACGSGHPGAQPAGSPSGGGGPGPVSGTVTVFAAASLTEPFTTLAGQFQRLRPAVRVKISYGASSALALQINQGASADVFASASVATMNQVIAAGGASGPVTFAKNTMEIAVPPGNPAKITGLADLARSKTALALCQPQVPCGAAARQVFSNAKLSVTPVTLEPDVTSVLTKVELGEVDAGVVYVSDVRTAGSKAAGIAIPPSVNAVTAYPVTVLAQARNPAAAQAFVDYVRSAAGVSVLTAAGFEKP